jgi:transcriptional regulator with XRE-family HTH domain
LPRKTHGQLYAVLGLRLKKSREARSLTQREAAALLKCPQSRISRIEKGQRRLDVHELLDMVRLYGTGLEDLVTDPTPEELIELAVPSPRG